MNAVAAGLNKQSTGQTKDPKVVDVTIGRLRQDLKGARQISIQPARHGYDLVLTGLSPSTASAS